MSGLEIADVDDDDDSYRAVMKGEGAERTTAAGVGTAERKVTSATRQDASLMIQRKQWTCFSDSAKLLDRDI